MESWMQLEAAWTVSMAACAAIIAVGGAIAALVRLYRWARKPSDENAETIEQMAEYLASDKRRIEALERGQEETERQSKLLLKSVVALMSHELDGNHTSQLAATRDEVQQFLIDK